VYRFSIHSKDKSELKAAVERYPEPVPGAQGVFYCGYNSERSFGGSAWLVQREGGNVMIDSPRFDLKLVKRIKVNPPHMRLSACSSTSGMCSALA
jgi:hypothetical protein